MQHPGLPHFHAHLPVQTHPPLSCPSAYAFYRAGLFRRLLFCQLLPGLFQLFASGYYDAYYLKALRVKALIKKAFDEAFAKYDVILGPVAPTTAQEHNEGEGEDDARQHVGTEGIAHFLSDAVGPFLAAENRMHTIKAVMAATLGYQE